MTDSRTKILLFPLMGLTLLFAQACSQDEEAIYQTAPIENECASDADCVSQHGAGWSCEILEDGGSGSGSGSGSASCVGPVVGPCGGTGGEDGCGEDFFGCPQECVVSASDPNNGSCETLTCCYKATVNPGPGAQQPYISTPQEVALGSISESVSLDSGSDWLRLNGTLNAQLKATFDDTCSADLAGEGTFVLSGTVAKQAVNVTVDGSASGSGCFDATCSIPVEWCNPTRYHYYAEADGGATIVPDPAVPLPSWDFGDVHGPHGLRRIQLDSYSASAGLHVDRTSDNYIRPDSDQSDAHTCGDVYCDGEPVTGTWNNARADADVSAAGSVEFTKFVSWRQNVGLWPVQTSVLYTGVILGQGSIEACAHAGSTYTENCDGNSGWTQTDDTGWAMRISGSLQGIVRAMLPWGTVISRSYSISVVHEEGDHECIDSMESASGGVYDDQYGNDANPPCDVGVDPGCCDPSVDPSCAPGSTFAAEASTQDIQQSVVSFSGGTVQAADEVSLSGFLTDSNTGKRDLRWSENGTHTLVFANSLLLDSQGALVEGNKVVCAVVSEGNELDGNFATRCSVNTGNDWNEYQSGLESGSWLWAIEPATGGAFTVHYRVFTSHPFEGGFDPGSGIAVECSLLHFDGQGWQTPSLGPCLAPPSDLNQEVLGQ